MPYVYSTLASDNEYAGYTKGGADLPVQTQSVLIKGGTGVADKRGDTQYGTVTEVTAEELKFLQENVVFQRHVANGFIQVSDTRKDPEKAAADMSTNDPGAPLTDNDFTEADTVKPSSKGKK